ncbi:MAG TPA: DUF5723 family protein [Bacteroidia bacterium]|nr:DUF5723 family protein [Bacteroidia bacterium]
MKVRTYFNVDGIQPPLAHLLAEGFTDPSDYNTGYHNRHIGINECTWFEIGGTYAKTIWTGADRFVSIGVRPKFLLGLAAAYVFIDNADYEFYNDSVMALFGGNLKFGHSDNFSFNENFQPSYRIGFNPGIGLDAGIIYEFRPGDMQKNEKPGKEWPGFRDRPVYKYRIGASLTDLGIIHFRSGAFTDQYSVSSDAWNVAHDVFNATAPAPLFNNFNLQYHGAGEGQSFWMRTPLALGLFYDYRFRENLFFSAQSFTGLYLRGTDFKKVHELTRISLTARYERRWYGAWVPVSFTRMGTFSMGAGLRLGPVIIGTTDILNLTMKNKRIYNADIYFALKVPLFPLGSGRKKKTKVRKTTDVDKCPG